MFSRCLIININIKIFLPWSNFLKRIYKWALQALIEIFRLSGKHFRIVVINVLFRVITSFGLPAGISLNIIVDNHNFATILEQWRKVVSRDVHWLIDDVIHEPCSLIPDCCAVFQQVFWMEWFINNVVLVPSCDISSLKVDCSSNVLFLYWV